MGAQGAEGRRKWISFSFFSSLSLLSAFFLLIFRTYILEGLQLLALKNMSFFVDIIRSEAGQYSH